jgi:hypothetical protein
MDFTAFHNSLTIRQFYVERVLAHQFAHEIVQGTSWKTTAAGAVGSTLHSNQHSQYEEMLGIPRQLAYLEDRIFEGLPAREAQAFPFAFLTSIPLGADLSLVLARFMLWLLIDPEHGVVRFAGKHGQVISDVAALYQRILNGEAVAKPEWPPLIHAASKRGKEALESAETFKKKSALSMAAAAEKASHAFDAAVVAAAAGYGAYGTEEIDPAITSALTDTVAQFGYGDLSATAADYGDATAFMVAYGDDLAAYAGLVTDRCAAAFAVSAPSAPVIRVHHRAMRDKLAALLKEAPVAANP